MESFSRLNPVLVGISPNSRTHKLTVPDCIREYLQDTIAQISWDSISPGMCVPFLHVNPNDQYWIPSMEDHISGGRLAYAVVQLLKEAAHNAGQLLNFNNAEDSNRLSIWWSGTMPERHKLICKLSKNEHHKFINTITIARW